MKSGAVKLSSWVFITAIMVLCGGCVSYAISDFNLAKLEESRSEDCPQIDAYFQPFGEQLYVKGEEFYDPTNGLIPRSHLFFSLLNIAERLDGSDISLSEPVHVRTISNKIELTFSKKNQEKITVTLPQEPNGDPGGWLIGGQRAYCKGGQLLIMHDYRVKNYESYSDRNDAIIFQMRDDG